jgi:hypothetical protein
MIWILCHNSQNHIFECWQLASLLPNASAASEDLVTTSTKDQTHIIVFAQCEINFMYPFLLMLYCHGMTAQYNSNTTNVQWVLITVKHGITGSYLHTYCAIHHVLWHDNWCSHSMIKVTAPSDSCVKSPSREFFLLHFNCVWNFPSIPIVIMYHFLPHPVYACARAHICLLSRMYSEYMKLPL